MNFVGPLTLPFSPPRDWVAIPGITFISYQRPLLTYGHGPDGRSGSPDDPKGQSYKKELVNPIAGNFLQVEHLDNLNSSLGQQESMHGQGMSRSLFISRGV
jgi:hypothetical protein